MILLFSDDVRFGSETAKRLREMGLPVVSHDPDFLLNICHRLDFCGVILDGRQSPQTIEALSIRLFERYPDAPVLFIAPADLSAHPCATQILQDEPNRDLFGEMLSFCHSCMGCENYATYALQFDPNTRQFTYLGYPIPLSDYENRFLLCLFRNAPNAVRTDDLLSEAFPNANTPRSTLWTIAKRINQASHRISGLKLVQCAYGVGYRLCDGIVQNPLHQNFEKGNHHDAKAEKRAITKN